MSCPIGGCAIDEFGDPLPERTLAECRSSHAVLLGYSGGQDRMRTRCARSTVCLITLFVTLTSVRGGADAKVSTDEAKQLFHRFLDRLKDDAPVTGEFEIKRTSMPGWGKGMPQRNRLLRCRWSWEPDREMLERFQRAMCSSISSRRGRPCCRRWRH